MNRGTDMTHPFSTLLRGVTPAFAVLAALVTGVPEADAANSAIEVHLGDGRGGLVRSEADRLEALARDEGRIPVIVRVRTGFTPETELSGFAAANQREAIASAQRAVLADVPGAERVWRFESVPMVSMQVTAAGVRALLDSPDVEAVYEDVARPLVLNRSVPFIRADTVWTKPGVKGGRGWAVAVLDTGVQIDHPALKGKVLAGACFSTNGVQGSKSFCPDGKEKAFSRKSARYCPLSIDGCEHGTHVSGIAVGRPPNVYKGVGHRASLIPIQVFTKFTGTDICDGDEVCPLSLTSDQMKGLEHVKRLSKKYKIASVNMSIGGGQYSSFCNDDPLKPIIDTLAGKGIAVVIASGNNGFNGDVSNPGCIQSAITVASTTLNDRVSSFSNFAKRLIDVAAPGSGIISSVPVSTFEAMSGTSMAAPHVAGAWALLRAADKKASVSDIRRVLKCSGKKVKRAGIKAKRIDVAKAYKKLIKQGCGIASS